MVKESQGKVCQFGTSISCNRFRHLPVIRRDRHSARIHSKHAMEKSDNGTTVLIANNLIIRIIQSNRILYQSALAGFLRLIGTCMMLGGRKDVTLCIRCILWREQEPIGLTIELEDGSQPDP